MPLPRIIKEKMRKTDLKKQIFSLLCLYLLLTTSTPQASIIDAPHNNNNHIKCGSCHSYSLWWKYSPSTQNIVPGRDAIINTVCMQCHDIGGTAPLARTHSAAVIGSTTYHSGVWGVGCTTCHNPHLQEQLAWVGTATSPYLITGTIDSVVSNSPQTGQTIVTYSAATTNANWPPEGLTSDNRSWSNKNNTGRGLIFVQDNMQSTNTFSIISASTGQIIINGSLSASDIDSSHPGNSSTCNTFGLMYGQLIRHTMTTPFSGSKDVRFFDPKGGFVGANADGICQVCHTAANHYKNDGIMPGTGDSHNGRDGMDCTMCHHHDSGFKGMGHDASSFGWSGTCNKCHSGADIVADVHKGNCADCHVDPTNNNFARRVGNPANGIDGSAVGANINSTCLDCHNPAAYPTPTIHHESSTHDYAVNGDCVQCHKADVGQAVGHSRANGNLGMPKNLACNFCHLFSPYSSYSTDANGRVKIFSFIFDPNTNPGQGFTDITALTTHTISKNTSTPISDYSACFACHGAHSYIGSQGTAPKVIPFHGWGKIYLGQFHTTDDKTFYDYWYNPANDNLNALRNYAQPIYPDEPGLLETSSFMIPWDNYAAGKPEVPVIMHKQFGVDKTIDVTVEVPLVNLSLH